MSSDGPFRFCHMMTLQRNGTDERELDLKKVGERPHSWMARLQPSLTVEASRSSLRILKTFDTSMNWNWLTGSGDRRLPNALPFSGEPAARTVR